MTERSIASTTATVNPIVHINQKRQHITMIDDQVLEQVAALGPAPLGLYAYLTRRCNREGTCDVGVAQLATALNVSTRRINDLLATLEQHGFLRRSTRLSPTGAALGIHCELPKHLRTYAPEQTPEQTTEQTPEPSCARTLEEVITEVKNPPLIPPRATAKRKTAMRMDWTPPDGMEAWAVENDIPAEAVADQLPRFRDYWISRGETRADWVASFRTWLRNSKEFAVRRAPSQPVTRPNQQAGLSVDQLLAMARGESL